MRIAKGVAGVAAAVIGGLYLLRALFFDAEWHIGITSTSKNIRTTESKDDAGDVNGFESGEVSRPGTVRAGADLAEEEGEEEENNRYAFVVQAPFPFPDGRRAALPRAGGVLKNARSVFAELSAPMLANWGAEYKDTIFSGGMHFSDGGRVVENKMLYALLQQGGFVAAFTGISVTAGHDCLFEESYPVLLNATMNRLMAATGVRFEAINVAMGNTRTAPYSYCVDAHAGLDADIVSWEMSMEVPDRNCGPAASAIELFIRSATVLPRRPAVLVMDASPDASKELCENPNRLRAIEKRNRGFMGDCDGTPPEESLMRLYKKFGLHQISPSSLVPEHACGDSWFSRSRLFKDDKHFPHPMIWHPAPAAHALVADMLFMHYAQVFLSALERLEEVAPGVTASELRDLPASSKRSLGVLLGLWSEQSLAEDLTATNGSAAKDNDDSVFMAGGSGSILPKAKWCAGWRQCEGAGNYRCASTYFPLAGREGSKLIDMVSERTPSLVNRYGKYLVVPPKEGHWAVTLNEVKAPILQYLKTAQPEGMHRPIDMKWVLVGTQSSGPIEFEFETIGVPPRGGEGPASPGGVISNATAMQRKPVADSRVVVCKPDFIDRVNLADPSGVRYSIDGLKTEAVRPLAHYGLTAGSCVLLAAEIGVGRHTLAVEPLKSREPFVAISHVLYPA